MVGAVVQVWILRKMIKGKEVVEQIPIVVVMTIVTALLVIGFLHAIGLWPEEWRF